MFWSQPNSFTFTVESVGIRPVQDIVQEGITAVLDLVAPYTDAARPTAEIGLTIQPADGRLHGVDLLFDGQEHTLGNLLQTLITEIYLDTEKPDSPITFVGYRVRHPLHRVMTLRIGVREAVAAEAEAVAREAVATAAQRAQSLFQELSRGWTALTGGGAASAAPAISVLDG